MKINQMWEVLYWEETISKGAIGTTRSTWRNWINRRSRTTGAKSDHKEKLVLRGKLVHKEGNWRTGTTRRRRPKGEDGESFTYDKFTPQQLVA